MQALAEAQLIFQTGYNPSNIFALQQWLLPENLQILLPSDPLIMYYVYVYDYDVLTDDATFLICQDNIGSKKNYPRIPDQFATEIMDRCLANSVRPLEGIQKVDAWSEQKLLDGENLDILGGL